MARNVENERKRHHVYNGADANVLPLDVYKQALSDVPMTRTDAVLTTFGNCRIRPERNVKVEVTCP